jgi:hypothetical protein
MRKSSLYLIVTGCTFVLLVIVLVFGGKNDEEATNLLRSSRNLARELRLTDLCLFTEARYTRHPAMADLHSAFQDHPMALEHFPSGSLVSPPATITRSDAPAR